MDCSLPGSSVHGDSPGKNTRVGCHALLQGIFPIQGSNPGLPHCGQILYCLSHQGRPNEKEICCLSCPACDILLMAAQEGEYTSQRNYCAETPGSEPTFPVTETESESSLSRLYGGSIHGSSPLGRKEDKRLRDLG